MRRLSTLAFLVLITHVVFGQVGSNDPTFNPSDQGFGYGDGAWSGIGGLALQPDGKVLVGGSNSNTSTFSVQGYGTSSVIVRLNADGTADPTFIPPLVTPVVRSAGNIVLQPDGKVLMAGTFLAVSGTTVNNIARMNADGSLDATFNTGGAGTNGTVYDMVLQPDGKIILAGAFTSVNGTAANRLVRLNANGTVDPGFNVGSGPNMEAYTLRLLNDGRLLVGGRFTSFNGTTAGWVVRLQVSGALDPAFVSAGFTSGAGLYPAIYTMDLQPDGRILFGGSFGSYGGVSRRGVVRTMADGASDGSFALDWIGTEQLIYSLKVQADGKVLFTGAELVPGPDDGGVRRALADGSPDPTYTQVNMPFYTSYGSDLLLLPNAKIIVCGTFERIGGLTRRRIARLNADGSVDGAYYPSTGANGDVEHMLRLPDGRILIGGSFSTYNGQERLGIARLLPDGAIDPTFIPPTAVALSVKRMAVDANGRIVILGFWTDNGFPYDLFRLLPDGSLDPSFTPYAGHDTILTSMTIGPDQRIYYGQSLNGVFRLKRMSTERVVDPGYNISATSSISGLQFQPDGKLLVTGGFSQLAGVSAIRMGRLNADGAPDPSFSSALGSSYTIRCMALQPDAKIMVGLYAANTTAPRVRRLNADGSLDAGFNTGSDASFGTSFPEVSSLVVQPDGRIIAGGWFTHFNGLARSSIVRLTATGAMDPTFDPLTGARFIKTMALQPDGNLLVAGSFTSYAGVGRNRVARVLGGANSPVLLALTALLDGPYNATPQLMADPLRTAGLLPFNEPYSALGYIHFGSSGQALVPSVLSTSGNNAIVDWVMVELRNLTNSVVLSQCALVQRDGDIVGLNGISPLSIPAAAGSYYIAVRHRNHLGVMTAAPISLSGNMTAIDFTNTATLTYGIAAQKQVGGKMLLWAGDATGNGQLRYTGAANDRDPLLTAVGSTTPNNTVSNVYDRRDTNLDGVIKYTGAANDRDIILTNVGSTTPNNTRTQQLP